MKKNTFMVGIFACSLLMLTACGEQKAGEGRTEEIHEKHVSHDELNEQQHQTVAQPAEDIAFEQPADQLQAQVNALLDDYLNLKNALVASSVEEAQQAASDMLARIQGFNGDNLPEDQQKLYSMRADALQDQTRSITQTDDLQKQRDHFAAITKHAFVLAKAFPPSQTIYYQYCPMAFDNNGGYWMSGEKEIRNPYFGDKMLKCGRVEETLAAN